MFLSFGLMDSFFLLLKVLLCSSIMHCSSHSFTCSLKIIFKHECRVACPPPSGALTFTLGHLFSTNHADNHCDIAM